MPPIEKTVLPLSFFFFHLAFIISVFSRSSAIFVLCLVFFSSFFPDFPLYYVFLKENKIRLHANGGNHVFCLARDVLSTLTRKIEKKSCVCASILPLSLGLNFTANESNTIFVKTCRVLLLNVDEWWLDWANPLLTGRIQVFWRVKV